MIVGGEKLLITLRMEICVTQLSITVISVKIYFIRIRIVIFQ